MSRDLSFGNFLRDLGTRIGAAAVVVGIFLGLGYLSRTDHVGLAGPLDTQVGFFGVAFLLVGTASVCWVVFQRSRS